MKNKISCPECERVFEVKDISVLPNKLLEPLLLEEKYLTNAEENIKANDRNKNSTVSRTL